MQGKTDATDRVTEADHNLHAAIVEDAAERERPVAVLGAQCIFGLAGPIAL